MDLDDDDDGYDEMFPSTFNIPPAAPAEIMIVGGQPGFWATGSWSFVFTEYFIPECSASLVVAGATDPGRKVLLAVVTTSHHQP